ISKDQCQLGKKGKTSHTYTSRSTHTHTHTHTHIWHSTNLFDLQMTWNHSHKSALSRPALPARTALSYSCHITHTHIWHSTNLFDLQMTWNHWPKRALSRPVLPVRPALPHSDDMAQSSPIPSQVWISSITVRC